METEGKTNETGGSSFEGERHDLKQKARNTADKARSQVRSFADSGRTELASQISSIGRALRDTGDKLRDEGEHGAQASRLTEMLADRADRVSHYLEEHDANELFDEVENIARRNPALFLGGCVAVGFVLGRFLKASPVGGGTEHEELPLGVTEPEPEGSTIYEGRSAYGGDTGIGGGGGYGAETSEYGAGSTGGYGGGTTGGYGAGTTGVESRAYESSSGLEGKPESEKGGAVETEEERKRREAKASERDTSASKTTAKSTEVIEVESSGSGYVQPIIATKRNGESGER